MAPQDWVLHVDMDQFLAAVELARRPELRGRPVVVGGRGDPTERAVVETASYEARAFGIRSGMPLRTAAKRCPEAVFLPSDRPAYEAVSEQVMEVLRRVPGRPGDEGGAGDDGARGGAGPVVVEVLGWDEAFLGVHTDDPEATARRAQQAVRDETGLSCSVGIGDNRLRAKLASGFAKPAGLFRLTHDNWGEVMADRPTEALWGIGARTARKLADAGITTVAQLGHADPAELGRRFGPTMGPWYRMLAYGVGDATVRSEPHHPKSRSRETTFQRNLTDRAALEAAVVALARRVAADVADEARPAVRVIVKVRFAPFFTQTRSMSLPAPTSDPAALEEAALAVLARHELGPSDRTRPVRLLGVHATLGQVAGGSAA